MDDLTPQQLKLVLAARSTRIAVLQAEVAHLQLVIEALARIYVRDTSHPDNLDLIDTVISEAETAVQQAEGDSATPLG